MYTKKQRHSKVIELIKNEAIERQEDIAKRLNDMGFMVTQATVSRDIRDLNLVKQSVNGVMRYVLAEDISTDNSGKLIDIFNNCVVSAESAQNLVVIKTLAGAAHAAAAALDAIPDNTILGTIAGDDTILVITKDSLQAESVKSRINDTLGVN